MWLCKFCKRQGTFSQVLAHEKKCPMKPAPSIHDEEKRQLTLAINRSLISENERKKRRALQAQAAEKRSKRFKQGGKGK